MTAAAGSPRPAAGEYSFPATMTNLSSINPRESLRAASAYAQLSIIRDGAIFQAGRLVSFKPAKSPRAAGGYARNLISSELSKACLLRILNTNLGLSKKKKRPAG